MVKNEEYWINRALEMEEKRSKVTAQYIETFREQYGKAIQNIQKDIGKFFARFADQNNVSFKEARRILNSMELEEFHWTVEEYLKTARENVFSNHWTKELENASMKVRVSRLEGMLVDVQHEVEMLAAFQMDAFTELLTRIYTDTYYESAFTIFKGVGVGYSFSAIDSRRINKALEKPWASDVANFSTRIWNNKDKLVDTLNKTLTQMIIQGKSPDETISRVAKVMNTSLSNAGRLVQTEEAHIASVAQKDCYGDLDLEKFQYVATLDETTCETCGPMDRQIFTMSEWQEGINVPPLHPWCRCTTRPYIEGMEAGERFARNAEGKAIRVPGDMTYAEWKKKFIKPTNKVNVDVPDLKGGDIESSTNFIEWGKAVKEQWGVKHLHQKLTDLDFDTLKQTSVKMDEVFKEFPQIKGEVEYISSDKAGWMNTEFNGTSIGLHFNEVMYQPKSIKTLNENYVDSVKSRYHPQGTDVRSNGVHELGHVVEAWMIKKQSFNKYHALEDWNDCETAQNILSRACRNAKKTPAGKGLKNYELRTQISRYALESQSETIAEAFADYFANGDNSAVLSKEIIKVIKSDIKEIEDAMK